MEKIYLFGLGNGYEMALKSIDFSRVRIEGLVDNYLGKNNQMYQEIKVITVDEIDKNIDYILVTAMLAYKEIKNQLLAVDVEEGKILCYFDLYDNSFQGIQFINYFVRMQHLFTQTYNLDIRMQNIGYEIADIVRTGNYIFPMIESAMITLKLIIEKGYSLARFGDGEFEIMLNRNRFIFQEKNPELEQRLKEVLVSDLSNILIAISDTYGDLSKYTKNGQESIRKYLTPSVRREHYQLIDMQKKYYNAFVSRPYILYQDNEYAYKIFGLWKKVWNNRDVVIVEGEESRVGYKNDLLNNAKSVNRILCPKENAWNLYGKIYHTVCSKVNPDTLILIALGPTATILAYDLFQEGYQALDIGHLDIEYEWYLMKADHDVNIEYKYINECGALGRIVQKVDDPAYTKQILDKVLE